MIVTGGKRDFKLVFEAYVNSNRINIRRYLAAHGRMPNNTTNISPLVYLDMAESKDILQPGAAMMVSTYPDADTISEIAAKVVKNRLAACVNVSAVSSFYSWDGKIMTNEQEQIAIFKTTSDRKDALKEVIKKTHPYDVPEIVEISVSDVNQSYLSWLISSTRGNNTSLR